MSKKPNKKALETLTFFRIIEACNFYSLGGSVGSELISHLNDTNFSEVVEKNPGPILVDFWAEWCMPCRALAPIIDELASEFNGKVRFAKLNVDEAREIPAKFGIRGIPTLILFQDGKKVTELVGNQPKDKIKTLLNSIKA